MCIGNGCHRFEERRMRAVPINLLHDPWQDCSLLDIGNPEWSVSHTALSAASIELESTAPPLAGPGTVAHCVNAWVSPSK
eukprot:5357962-Amphidinium_carterae.1